MGKKTGRRGEATSSIVCLPVALFSFFFKNSTVHSYAAQPSPSWAQHIRPKIESMIQFQPEPRGRSNSSVSIHIPVPVCRITRFIGFLLLHISKLLVPLSFLDFFWKPGGIYS
jgi:hypothetical protein